MKKIYILKYTFIIIFIILNLYSCGIVTKQYKKPYIENRNIFVSTNNDSINISKIPWREYFKDKNLQLLIEDGLANNLDMLIADTRIKQAEAYLSISNGNFLPEIGLSGQASTTRTNSKDANTKNALNRNNYSLGLYASWEIELWGKLSSSSRASRALLLKSYAYKNLIQTNLIANIAQTYYTLLSFDEQLRVTEEVIKIIAKSTETISYLKDFGDLNAASLEQSKSFLYNSKSLIPDLKYKINEAETLLSTLLGRHPGRIKRGSLNEQLTPPELKTGISVQMLSNRPDVIQAELDFRNAFELTNVARANFYPTISIKAPSVGYVSDELSNFLSPSNIITNILGNIAQPIFSQNKLKGQLKAATAKQEEALLLFRESVLNAESETVNILYKNEISLDKEKLIDLEIGSLEKSVNYAIELLKTGNANYLEVLTAEQNLLQARLKKVSQKLEQLEISISLYKSLGGGIN